MGTKQSACVVARRSHALIGHQVTSETRAKISVANRGRKRSAESRLRIAAAQKGKILSAATRAKMSVARIGHDVSADTRAKIGAANSGKQRSDVQRAAMSITHEEAGNRPEVIEKHREARRAWWTNLTDDRRAKLLAARSVGQAARWAKLTIDVRRRLLKPAVDASIPVMKAAWAAMSKSEKVAKLAPVWKASQSANPSSIEETVALILDAIDVTYERQALIGRYLVDFLVSSKRLVIECDGSYWHSLPGRREKDATRDAWLKSRGFDVLRLPEPIIRSGQAIDVLSKVAG